mgnify:CR=1 FL=1
MHLCDLQGRYVVVTLPLFKMHFLDLFDEVYHTIAQLGSAEPCGELRSGLLLSSCSDTTVRYRLAYSTGADRRQRRRQLHR